MRTDNLIFAKVTMVLGFIGGIIMGKCNETIQSKGYMGKIKGKPRVGTNMA